MGVRAGLALGLLAATGFGPAAFSAPGAAGPASNLPETLRATVQVPNEAPRPRLIDTLRDLYPALTACWTVPEGLAGFERTEITARFALRSDGSVIGVPRITFARQDADGRGRAILTRATLDAIRRCTPVAISPALGGAIAGRPIALRFIYQGPIGQGA